MGRDRIRRRASAWLLGLLLGCSASAAAQGAATGHTPDAQSQTILRIWGIGSTTNGTSPVLGILTKLENEYRKDHPEVSFVHHLSGNDSALGGLYIGAADLALMDRNPSYIELDGYQQVITGAKPFEVALMRGGIKVAGHSSPLVVIVNRENPLQALSVAQLNSIFNAEHAAGDKSAGTWGDLGLQGDWSSRPLQLYGFGVETPEARTFSETILHDSRRWACAYREVDDAGKANAARRVAEAIAQDRAAIGLTTLDAVAEGSKIVAIATSSGAADLPTPETLASGQYPLGRTVMALAKAQPDGRADAKVHSFLAYMVSARAQALIGADGTYIPLADPLLAPEREKLP